MRFRPVGYTSMTMSTSGIQRLSALPQRPYLTGPSPLQRMERLSALFGGPDVLIKRDDTLPLALGGNKVRKLTYVVADALAQGADTLITTGAIQSNHCLLTLAAANREGIACRLVLEERVPGTYNPEASGNNFLYRLLGAERIDVVDRGDTADGLRRAEAAARAEGRTPYVIPGGASNPLGGCGYASCAVELLGQCEEMGLTADRIVCASGSGGTHAGLVAGLIAAGSDIEVTGINVSRSRAEQEPHVTELTEAILAFLGLDAAAAAGRVTCRDEWLGPGYSLPSAEMLEAVTTVARTQGIVLDPVYTGKAMAGLIGMIRGGELHAGQTAVFLHTGGTSALFANRGMFTAALADAGHDGRGQPAAAAGR